MDPLVLLISATVLLAVFFLVLSIGGLGRRGAAERLKQRLGAYQSDLKPQPGVMALQLRRRSYSGLPGLSAFLAHFKGSEKVALQLERAGVPLRVGEYYMIRYGMAALFFLVPFVFNRTPLALGLGLGLGVVGYILPAWYIGSRRKARMAQMSRQLVEMLGLVSNSLKSGYGLMQSFDFAAGQMKPPLALELRRMLREANLGLSAEDALTALGERINSPDMDMVLTAVTVQRTVGGNLAEIMDNVAFTMRERERIRGEIKTLTSQQMLTGWIIGGLPVGVGLLFLVINPDYMSLLFTESLGRLLLLAAAGLEVVGVFAIKRVLAVEV